MDGAFPRHALRSRRDPRHRPRARGARRSFPMVHAVALLAGGTAALRRGTLASAELAKHSLYRWLQRIPFERRYPGVEIVLPLLGQHGAFQPAGNRRSAGLHRPFRPGFHGHDQPAGSCHRIIAKGRVAILVHQRGEHHGGRGEKKSDDFLIESLTYEICSQRQLPRPREH